MDMEEVEMDYEEEDYQSTSLSSNIDLFSELLLATSDEKFIEIILKIKNDKEKFLSIFNSFKDLKEKRKASTHIKKIQSKVAQLLINLKQNDRYTETESQQAVFWFLRNFFEIDLIDSSEDISNALKTISSEFTTFEDFMYLTSEANEMRLLFKKTLFSSERLHYLYHEKYDKLEEEKTRMKFGETMKNLDEEKKFIVKAEVIELFRNDISHLRIESSEIQPIINLLAQKPYAKLFECILNKRMKCAKNFKTSILKSKLEIRDGKSEVVFGPKCDIHNDLKTKEMFELTAKKSDGSELIPEFDTEAIIIHGDYLYTKWSQDIVISAKEKVSFESSTQGLNEGFLKLLSFFKKLFEHRHKNIRFFGSESKMIEEGSQQTSPKETVDYICHSLQLLVKYLSFNSIEINHREQNLGDLIPSTFLEELLKFYEIELKNVIPLEKTEMENKDDKKSKNIVIETIDYLVSLAAHLFYRRDFQSITAITSKTSQSLLRILLDIPNFPYRWAVLRNYKLVIDRWSESVPEGSEEYKSLIKKFLESYFNDKVIVVSKSSSTVFNPIFLTRAYCKILGSELLTFVSSLEKEIDEYVSKTPTSNVVCTINSKVSKVILFMSTRVRYSESNKIAEHLSNIYKKYAHIVPEIYLFRSWISQLNFNKCNQVEIFTKLTECLDVTGKLSEKIQKLNAQNLLTPICNLNQEEFSEILKLLNNYKNCHSRVMNSLEIKPKSEELGEQVLRSLIEITKRHIEVFFEIYVKTKEFESLEKETHDFLREENELHSRNGNGSISMTIQETKKNIMALVRYYICNAEKILTIADYSSIVGSLGSYVREFVIENEKEKDNEKISFFLKNLNILIGLRLPLAFNCHLMKNQILGAARAINGAEQLGLKKNDAVPFNEVVAFYEQIKSVYPQFIKILIETKSSENTKKKSQEELTEACNQILYFSIFPYTCIAGKCNFNGKLENKSTENMVFGVFLEQAQILSTKFSIDKFLSLNEKYSFEKMLKITQDKQSKITEQKVSRANQGGIFVGMRSNRDRTEVRNELMDYGYTEDQIQIALENIEVPDATLASEWIQNNQETIENLLIEKAIKKSQEETIMKQKVETKVEVGKIAPVEYSEFKDKLKESMDKLVKTLWKQLFENDIQKGKKMTDLVFAIIDAFKDKYKSNQYLNFSKKMFSEIEAMKEQMKKPEYKFDDKKYRLILYIINLTLKREPQVFKNYYQDKDGICLKVLEFVGLFGQGFQNEVEKRKERSEDFSELLQIVNKTLPDWKSPLKEVKPELVDYLSCLLDLICLSNLGNKDVWQILSKISSLELSQLREKTISLFSNIVLSKHILEEEREKLKQENKVSEREKRNIFYKAPRKSLPSKIYMLPLITTLCEQDKQLSVSNIELEIKRYLATYFKQEFIERNKMEEIKRLPIEIDLKSFSSAFEKFIGNSEFEKVFKRLFNKKKNKKNSIFYDFTKHPLNLCEFIDENSKQSFISLKFDSLVEQILQTMISCVLQFSEEERELQEESLISLYKFLDYYKVLIPTALRTQFINPQTNKLTTLIEWLICDTVALNEKKYHFMTFLSMNNHLFADEKQSISDWVCNEYMKIFRNEIESFSQYLNKKKGELMIESSSQSEESGFKEETLEEVRFKKVMFNFMYLLQVNKFNSQCFLKTTSEESMKDQIERLFIHLDPTEQPILYTLISEIIFILRKREMIELFKDKYEIHSPEIITDQNKTLNLNKEEFLNMSLIYNVDPVNIGESSLTIKVSRRRNIFSGSSGRIIVDEIEDEEDEDEEMNWDEMEANGDFYDEIGDLVGLRARRRDQNNTRLDANGDSFLYPSEAYLIANRPLPAESTEQQPNQTDNQPQEEKTEKIEEERHEEANKEIQDKVLSQFDYAELLKEQSEKLIETIKNVESSLPSLRTLGIKSKSQQKITEYESEKMVSENENKNVESTNEFLTSLQTINNKVQENTSLIVPANTRFDPSSEIVPEFFCRLGLKENIPKLIKFDKRFKSMIMTFCPEVKLSVWENDHNTSSRISGSEIIREIPNARWLLSRLERDENRENRDRMLESIFNISRGNLRQDEQRPSRILNLHEAVQALPEQPEPPKEEEKLKSEEKQVEKEISEVNVEVKNYELSSQQNITESLPVEEKIIEEKPESKNEEKMEEEKPVQSSEQKVEEKPLVDENSMSIEEEKPIQPESIIPEEPIAQQPIADVQPPQEVMAETGPYREILAMFGLPQTFLADNGIDPESFDSLPEEFQIDQITHYMNQAQNRLAVNQLNQANQPVQQNVNQQQPGENSEEGQQNQGGIGVNDVLQENIALFASMDPETRMEMLADYPPEFLMQLPVQMRTEVEQYRQRQLRRFASSEEEENQYGLREALINQANKKKDKNAKDLKKDDVKYPSPEELNFNPVADSLAEHLAKSIFLKVEKTPMINGFRFLLEHYLTQEKALATIVGILNIEEGLKTIELERKTEEEEKKNSEKSERSIVIPKKEYWSCENLLLTDAQEINNIKQTLLNLVFDTLSENIYKNPDFLMKKVHFNNYLNLKIEPQQELEADKNGFWPLYELLSYSLSLCPKLSVEILKRVKSLPLRLIKCIVQSIRADKLSPEIYKNLELLSKNEDMKRLFMEEFPEDRPLKLETFAKVIKYEFARVPYLKKLHEEALNYYSAEYNEFLNQIFGIYTIEDIKEIESILMKHKNVHFQVIKYLYSLNRVLDKEPMGLILKMPHLLDFETKKYLFRKHPKIRRGSRYRLPIEVSRTNILQESFNQIMSKTPKELEGRLQVTFMDEQGYDAGGLTREWLLCLSREIFNPNYGLFEPSSSGNTYQPNPKSYVNPDHLEYFKFIGRFVGKALAENELVDAYFTRAFYKMVLGQEIELSDLEQQDYSFYKSMLWLKENKIEEGDYTFSYLYDNFGQRIVKDLIPGGRDINVNEQNKQCKIFTYNLEYIEKYCLAKMRDDFKVQIEKFLEGFHEIVPHECINFFEAKELELLISGLPEINFEDLKNNVDYSGYAPTDQAIKWFWEILEEFTQEDLARLIQFITGTSKIPVDGFANIKGMNGPQRISIHKDPNSHQLPKAHTCFNQLDLPNYDTKEVMRERIVTAITWGSEGFGFM